MKMTKESAKRREKQKKVKQGLAKASRFGKRGSRRDVGAIGE
jgi:hypothetical protein